MSYNAYTFACGLVDTLSRNANRLTKSELEDFAYTQLCDAVDSGTITLSDQSLIESAMSWYEDKMDVLDSMRAILSEDGPVFFDRSYQTTPEYLKRIGVIA